MFCPECRYEYEEGMTTCPDCGSKLVGALPSMNDETPVEYEEILSIYSPGDIALIKGILQAEGISFYFKGENYTSQLAGPARLMVEQEKVADTLELLRDYMEADDEQDEHDEFDETEDDDD